MNSVENIKVSNPVIERIVKKGQLNNILHLSNAFFLKLLYLSTSFRGVSYSCYKVNNATSEIKKELSIRKNSYLNTAFIEM